MEEEDGEEEDPGEEESGCAGGLTLHCSFHLSGLHLVQRGQHVTAPDQAVGFNIVVLVFVAGAESLSGGLLTTELECGLVVVHCVVPHCAHTGYNLDALGSLVTRDLLGGSTALKPSSYHLLELARDFSDNRDAVLTGLLSQGDAEKTGQQD